MALPHEEDIKASIALATGYFAGAIALAGEDDFRYRIKVVGLGVIKLTTPGGNKLIIRIEEDVGGK